jgi:hypothetical protein
MFFRSFFKQSSSRLVRAGSAVELLQRKSSGGAADRVAYKDVVAAREPKADKKKTSEDDKQKESRLEVKKAPKGKKSDV